MNHHNSSQFYNGIDVCKFVMAVFVVAIHTNPLAACNNELVLAVFDTFFSLAVPFFFMASGFFLGKKMTETLGERENMTVVLCYLKRMIRLYLIWTILYFPLAIYSYIVSEKSIIYCILHFVRGLVLIGEHYNSWILWYLLSTIYALCLLLFLCKRGVHKTRLLVYSIVVLMAGFLMDWIAGYSGSLPAFALIVQKGVTLSFGNGRLFRGFFFITIGILLSKQEMKKLLFFFLFIIGFVLNVLFDGFVGNLCMTISAIGLFVIVVRFEGTFSIWFWFMRKASTVIYFVHLYVWTAYYMIVYGKKTYGLDCFAFVCLISIVLAIVWLFVCNKIKERKITR